ncbi:3961_t:CDS:1, partial [Dentiscutata heterogama]
MVKKLLNVCKRVIKKLKPRKHDQNVIQEKENTPWSFWKKVLPRKRERKRKDNTVIQNQFKDPVFSPSLPTECLIEVFTYVQDDLRTLNACLLVSKEWCNVVIPLYWSRPFHCKTSANVINTYLQCLSKHEQQNIRTCGIKLKRNRAPTFYYANLLRELSMSKLYLSVDSWIHISQKSI